MFTRYSQPPGFYATPDPCPTGSIAITGRAQAGTKLGQPLGRLVITKGLDRVDLSRAA